MEKNRGMGPMFNAYPDSIGGNLQAVANLLSDTELKGIFDAFYVLPSVFHSDLDRGFSIIDYGINESIASKEALQQIQEEGISLKLDFILNHLSVQSMQFKDILENGSSSKYKDFFIDWNKFWKGKGKMTEQGYIQPEKEYLKKMFFRKPGLPILMVRFPDGSEVPYWNTFYQKITYPVMTTEQIGKLYPHLSQVEKVALKDKVNQELANGRSPKELELEVDKKQAVITYLEANRRYLGQMDLNIKSPLVWEYYDQTLKTLAGYGAAIIRLDAFAYAPKEPGERNFLNDPGTWELLKQVQELADHYNVTLLPEIHASYEEKIYELLAEKKYMVYDFFLPGLLIDAIESGNGERLAAWANETIEKKIRTVNMLGCHDGIPLLDLKGMLSEKRIEELIALLVKRGGYVKNLHGQKAAYYQVNCTYYSALGENDDKMLAARAIQMFLPGIPQVWYLDLFAGTNDYEAVKRAGADGHKEINRTNLTKEEVMRRLKLPVVQKQIELLRFRHIHPAFADDADVSVLSSDNEIAIKWQNGAHWASLKVDLNKFAYEVQCS